MQIMVGDRCRFFQNGEWIRGEVKSFDMCWDGNTAVTYITIEKLSGFLVVVAADKDFFEKSEFRVTFRG